MQYKSDWLPCTSYQSMLRLPGQLVTQLGDEGLQAATKKLQEQVGQAQDFTNSKHLPMC